MRGQPESGLLLHVDQCVGIDARSEMLSIQGAYNFFSVEAEDSGLVVVPSSHKRWAKYTKHFDTIRPAEPEFAWAYAAARKLLIPANCFELWNSKTLHGNAIGQRERPDGTDGAPEPNRLTCFVSLFPAVLHSEEGRAQKLELYIQGGSSSHWGATGAEPHPINRGGVGGRLLPDGSIPPERLALL